MSVVQSVFLEREKLPSMAAWRDAILRHGFDLDLDAEIDVATHEGMVPCSYRGEKGGFEYYLAAVDRDEFEPHVVKQLSKRDAVVTFATGGHMASFVSAGIAAYVLATISDGLYAGEDAESMDAAADCIARARELEADANASNDVAVPVTPPTPTPAQRVALALREKFRGANLVVVETTGEPSLQCTLKVGPSVFPPGAIATITELARDSAGRTFVKEVKVGDRVVQFDRSGALVAGSSAPDLEHLAATLGSSDAPLRGLRDAGAAAIPILNRLLQDPSASSEQKRLAQLLLSQIKS